MHVKTVRRFRDIHGSATSICALAVKCRFTSVSNREARTGKHRPMRAQARRHPTPDEVAARAGVSRTVASRTVASRAINNAPNVSRGPRDAAAQAVRALGYVPNPTARALVTSQGGTVLLAVSHDGPPAGPGTGPGDGPDAGCPDDRRATRLAAAADPPGGARLSSLTPAHAHMGCAGCALSAPGWCCARGSAAGHARGRAAPVRRSARRAGRAARGRTPGAAARGWAAR